MPYSKPELLAAEVALNAIGGSVKSDANPENFPEFPDTVPAYEVDE